MRILPAIALAAACASSRPAPTAADAAAIVAAPDRTERDRAMDSHRKPVEMLTFFGTAPGMRVGEIGAGGGYSTELFARAVGPGGKVYAQDSPTWDSGGGLSKWWEKRIATPAMTNSKHEIRPWEDPLPAEARDLDAVYIVAAYHDVLAEKHDTAALNRAVFAALKPGGVYAIIDNSAKAGTGAADADRLHRVDEQFLIDEVQKAGFRLAGRSDFLRNPQDTRDWSSDSRENKTHTQDRFALKFVK